MKNLTSIALFAALAFSLANGDPTQASAQGSSNQIFARGTYRDHLQSLPIEARPNRPFHFYGNTVRRLHHGNSVRPNSGSFQPIPLPLHTTPIQSHAW